MKTVTFFRYCGMTWAINHGGEANDQPLVLPYTECIQYKKYRELMDAASRDLEGEDDEQYTFGPNPEWTRSPLPFAVLAICTDVCDRRARYP